MAEIYLPRSRTDLLIDNGTIVGFLSFVDDYIAALFVDRMRQQQGCGTKLLDHAKRGKQHLHLKVYQKNEQAVRFYQRNGFYIAGESMDEAVSEMEWIMRWNGA